MRHFVRIFIKITGWISLLIFFKPKVYYEDKKVQKRRIKKGALIISNHKKPLDFMFIFYLFITRSIHCIVAETIYESNKFVTWILDMLGSIKTNRFTKDMTFLSKAINILNRGGVVEIFPEGRLPINDELLPFNPSYIYIALHGNAPILPIYHTGDYGFFKRQKAIIGKPIDVRSFIKETEPTKIEIENLNQYFQNKIIELKQTLEAKLNKK